ncbi:MAG: metal ABC transporter permease [Deltaproteobacteria bacterium]|nr:metal ABC transporter permease [Deltaproteobacteria bacterium]
MWDILHLEFMRNALIAGILVSIICGIIGTLVVVNRIVFISGGIAHAAFGGIGLAFFVNIPPLAGAAVFSLIVSMIMAAASFKRRERADTIIGVLWAIGMAVGVLLADLTPGYNADLMSYLFGSILSVPLTDVFFMVGLGVLVLIVVTLFYKELLAMSYDEEFSFVVGVPVKALYFLLIGLVSLSIVLVIRVVGLILVIALLTIPPYISERHTRSLGRMMILASGLSMLFTLTGIWFSYLFDLTSGATIILVAGVAFFISLLIDSLKARMKQGVTRG